jgi:hypothetical protein
LKPLAVIALPPFESILAFITAVEESIDVAEVPETVGVFIQTGVSKVEVAPEFLPPELVAKALNLYVLPQDSVDEVCAPQVPPADRENAPVLKLPSWQTISVKFVSPYSIPLLVTVSPPVLVRFPDMVADEAVIFVALPVVIPGTGVGVGVGVEVGHDPVVKVSSAVYVVPAEFVP